MTLERAVRSKIPGIQVDTAHSSIQRSMSPGFGNLSSEKQSHSLMMSFMLGIEWGHLPFCPARCSVREAHCCPVACHARIYISEGSSLLTWVCCSTIGWGVEEELQLCL